MTTLQKALLYNAIFSILSGITLILFNIQIAEIFEITNSTIFWIIGVVLIYFSITIFYEIKKLRTSTIKWIIIQDFLWVIGSLMILIFSPFNISKKGNLIILIIVIIVFFMGINQLKSLNKKR